MMPTITKEPSPLRIVTLNGEVFYAHNIKDEYRYDERLKAIENFKMYFQSLSSPTPEQDAYSALLWHLFPDFLNAYSFKWLNKPNNAGRQKHLYIVRNSLGFIKVGVSGNVKVRMVDLRYEFEGDFEILKVYYNKGNMEKYLHGKLMGYLYPVKKRHTGKYSTECFVDCPEVVATCLNLSHSE